MQKGAICFQAGCMVLSLLQGRNGCSLAIHLGELMHKRAFGAAALTGSNSQDLWMGVS
ncbi:hypothetical protein BN13_290014 [Nostocoides jenkinsii Ben 74]|uniref:Uncharacterized protein n=1 Tax=Nostocoides jenkinsii Ben 74 TaxID=1193518 RepID=A0A077M6Y1_9MICO|nr:hypothetical protein BN13_290014 [Tetrasphaera jenkinsii Ben 74]